MIMEVILDLLKRILAFLGCSLWTKIKEETTISSKLKELQSTTRAQDKWAWMQQMRMAKALDQVYLHLRTLIINNKLNI